ncbi:hypothetical protein F4802DRAFT_602975 [Xylaria palmicola]|nr:hypothetical protein F4802DRAFT_602975 [Xylaria palmicola]
MSALGPDMSPTRHHVLLFGDQTDNVTGTIRDLYVAGKGSGLLSKFLRDASDLCQIEFGNLQPCFRGETPSFESLLEMAEVHAETDGSPVLASCALSYFARLGELILRAEHDPTILSAPRVLLGLCINLFPAALAATAKSPSELAKLSLEGFPSFFTWVVANQARTKQIEWPHGIWSCMVLTQAGVDLQALLDKFYAENDVLEHKRTWIGVVGCGWVTVSGPPSTLKLLMAKSPGLDGLSFVPLPVASAVHAPHIPAFDFESTAKPSYIWNLPLQADACIIATDDCVPYTCKTLGEVTRHILQAVLQRPLMVKGTFAAAARYLKDASVTAAVSQIGPSAQTGSLLRALKQGEIPFKVLPCPRPENGRSMRSGSGLIAIVGMSARLPQADDLEQYWKLLMEKRTTHERVPHDRFDLDEFYDPSGTKENMIMNTDGCFLAAPGAFDARVFKMSPREAMQVDPTHRLLLMTSLEALEKAGYAGPSSRNGREAVYFGQNADAWREVSVEQGVDVFTAPGLLRAFAPGRVSHHFGFEGGSYSVDSACSSSATAIQLACAGLVSRECDMALAGGAQITGGPFEFAALGKSGFLAPSGGCKTFCADADGYCRGEAVGVVVLKRLEDALWDNDNIEAVISGWGRNYSAGATSMTHPHPEAQESLIRQVLRQANAKPSDIGYVELHGTGTTVGDMAEMTLITRVFGPHFKPSAPIHIGSVKANVGHSESAAGVSSVIKAALMLRKGVIPPQAMISPETQLHPGYAKLEMSSILIDSEPSTLEAEREKILVNSFDAAGGNTCLLIEKAPEPVQAACDSDLRSWHLVTVSAQTGESLRNNKRRLLEYLINEPEEKLSNVAYSTTARRTHYPQRSVYTVESVGQLVGQLKEDIARPGPNGPSTSSKPKVVFLFSGQGSSYYDMVGELYKTHPFFRGRLDTLWRICEGLCPDMRRGIISILTERKPDTNDSFLIEEHLAIVCAQLALSDLWKSWGVEPDIVLGHSIGEYTALCVAGVLSLADTLWLVSNRARLFETTYRDGEYGMLSISATAGHVLDLVRDYGLDDTCSIACFNGHESHVVGGPTADLRILENHVTAKNIPTKLLAMSHAVHCGPIDQVYSQIEDMGNRVSFFPPRIPVSSTVTGEIITQDNIFTPQYFARHAREPVQLSRALKSVDGYLAKDQTNHLWVEIGPGSTCLGFLRQTLKVTPHQLLPSLNWRAGNWEMLAFSLAKAYAAGLSIDWPEFHRPFKQSLKLLDLPTYAFDLKTFWRRYTKATAAASGIRMSSRENGDNEFVPTATIHKIRNQKVGCEKIEVTFASSLSNGPLRDAIKGHSIEGFCICPASVYVDMAFTAAAHAHRIAKPGATQPRASLRRLELSSPFVLKEDSENQVIEVRVIAEKENNWDADISFHSQDGDGQIHDHGSCRVVSGNNIEEEDLNWEDELEWTRCRSKFLMEGSVDDDEMQTDHLRRRMLYTVYDTVVHYGSRYQGIVEAIIQEMNGDEEIEATADVELTAPPADEAAPFMVNPYHSDSLVHVGGFALNIRLADDDADAIYFSSGIGSITLFGELTEKERYLSYFRASAAPEGQPTGDVYIFCGKQLAGLVEGLTFRKIKRDVLKALLQEANADEISPVAGQEQNTVLPCHHRRPNSATKVAVANQASDKRCNMADAFISALIEETGITQGDIDENTKLCELGVDSLMGIAIMRRVKANTGRTLPVSIFSELPTIKAVRDRLGSFNSEADEDPKQDAATRITGPVLPIPTSPQADLTTLYRSNAVLLHGDADAQCPRGPLFFIAGSSGSAAIFAQIPGLASSTAVWALESPFLYCPSEAADRAPQEIAPVYAAAIKAIQPAGPYLLGGYSAGAVHAYEVARLLLDGGEEVDRLVLVDMKAHCPGESWGEAPRMADVEALGVTLRGGTCATGLWVANAQRLENERLFASLRCIYNWKPTPMAPGRRPKNGTVMIWARWGMNQRSSGWDTQPDSRVNPMAAENTDYRSWFCAPRHTYDANGWDVLVGDVQTYVVDGDHWDMLQMPCAAELSKLIDQAITGGQEN